MIPQCFFFFAITGEAKKGGNTVASLIWKYLELSYKACGMEEPQH
jgi:hypothetical protein